MKLSVVVPARNEAALIAGTLTALLVAARRVPTDVAVEVCVVDNASVDGTADVVRRLIEESADALVRIVRESRAGAAWARNAGVAATDGDVLVFVDADTRIPAHGLDRIVTLRRRGYACGLFGLRGDGGGLRAWLWWTFWGQVRRLPLPYAKAMPAFMFCTRAVFDAFGPFDTSVQIAEEWPVLAQPYRARPHAFAYDRTTVARSSNRRMELRPFGYTRTFAKYVWAVLHRSGRVRFTDRIRDAAEPVA